MILFMNADPVSAFLGRAGRSKTRPEGLAVRANPEELRVKYKPSIKLRKVCTDIAVHPQSVNDLTPRDKFHQMRNRYQSVEVVSTVVYPCV
jgi:hypothetical protein